MSTAQNFENFYPGNIKKALEKLDSKKAGAIFMIPVNDIHVMEGFNVRLTNEKNKEYLEILATSMLSDGFFSDKPLSGFVAEVDGESIIQINDGHTRLQAVKMANERGALIEKIPVSIVSGRNITDFTIGLISKNNGRQLNGYEQSLVVQRLLNYGLKPKDINERTGVSLAAISQYHRYLFIAPPQIHDWLREGVISANYAIEMIKKHKGNAVTKIQEYLDKLNSKNPIKKTDESKALKTFFRKKAPNMSLSLSKIKSNNAVMDLIRSTDEELAEEIIGLATESEDLLGKMLS